MDAAPADLISAKEGQVVYPSFRSALYGRSARTAITRHPAHSRTTRPATPKIHEGFSCRAEAMMAPGK